MKTILCPTDFSKSADKTSRYAAQLAKDTNAKIILAATPTKKSKVLAGDWPDETDHLYEIHDLLKANYQIPCGIEEEVVNDNVYKKLSKIADRYDLMIFGMQFGSEGLPRHSAGIDLIKIIQETLAPLLIVPEKFEYKKINRLLYAYDYQHEPEPPLLVLQWLADWFNVELRFISIYQDDISTEEERHIDLIENKIANQWKSKQKLSFESIQFENVPMCLEHYLNLWSPNDLLILSVNHQNMLQKLWHKSVVKCLLASATHPYLIIHK
ncbi:MAG TPA: hypothetical protein DGG95_18255 [Cytophagales bacterium]|jgi:hypothetical protein|nr:hypothetical protein [Cytophagales bacterium]